MDTKSFRPDNLVWCCNCGKKGHLVDHCHKFLYSEYPVCPLRVVNYSMPVSLGDYEEEAEDEKEKVSGGKSAKNDKKRRRRGQTPTGADAQDRKRRSGPYGDPASRSRRQPPNKASRPVQATDKLSDNPWMRSISKANLDKTTTTFNHRRQEKKMKAKIRKARDNTHPTWRETKFQQRIETGMSKKEKKRQKFYNSLLAREATSSAAVPRLAASKGRRSKNRKKAKDLNISSLKKVMHW